MKRLFKKLFYWLRYGRKTKRFEEYNSTLLKDVVEKRVEKRKLKAEIKAEVKRYLNIKANSRYITKRKKNTAEIAQYVNAKFGTRMEEVGIIIKNDLTLCDI